MSGSETAAAAVVTTTEQFSIGVHQKSPSPAVAAPVVQNMHLAYNSSDGTPLYKPISSSGGGGGGGAAPFPPQQQQLSMMMNAAAGGESKKKRGRPRKYGPDGSMALALTPSPVSAQATNIAFSSPNQSQQQPANSPDGGSGSGSLMKKARGRPPGSSNKKHHLEALGSAGIGFTPHVISVKAGEDVSSKIMSFSQNGPRAVCILSASGAISNVTLRQAATSGGTATYEGRFDILSLSGSFLLSEVGGQRSRTGGLSVSLAGPDGRVLGGCVAGLLTAASPVQVIVGSFIADGRKEPRVVNHLEPLSAPQHFTPGSVAAGPGSPQSRGTLSESSGGAASPLTQSTGAFHNSHPQGMSSMPWK